MQKIRNQRTKFNIPTTIHKCQCFLTPETHREQVPGQAAAVQCDSVIEINVCGLWGHMQLGWEQHLGWALKVVLMDQHVQ